LPERHISPHREWKPFARACIRFKLRDTNLENYSYRRVQYPVCLLFKHFFTTGNLSLHSRQKIHGIHSW
jgi:hypothetical protein